MKALHRRQRATWLAAVFFLAAAADAGCGDDPHRAERSAPVIATQPALLDGIRITVLYDNIPYRTGPVPDWGFSCLVEGAGDPILFDAGGSAAVLAKNLAVLGIDLAPVDTVFISHAHHDHTGGLGAVLADQRPRTFFVPHSIGSLLSGKEKKRAKSVVPVTEPVKVGAAAFSTGRLDSFIADEQALVVDTDGGLVVIAGCAHPGVAAMVSRAKELGGKRVLLVMGGFHLMGASAADIRETIAALQQLGVCCVAPSHCTGPEARRMFAAAFGAGYIDSGAGRVISGKDLAGR